jgi:hypothetical protein
MARRFAALLVFLVGVGLGCSDATSPETRTRVTVSPDTARFSPGGGGALIFYERRNGSGSEARIVAEGIEVQAELAPGDWRTVADSLNTNVPFVLRNGEVALGPSIVKGIWSAAIDPGLYRLSYAYRTAGADGTPSGDRRVTYSNVFVVVPR